MDGSQPLDNSRHERFACELAKGDVSQDQAYVNAGYSNDRGAASRLSANVNILERVKWLKSQAASDTVLTIKEKREFCARLVRSKVGELGRDSDLWNSVKVTEDGTEYKLPDKLAAIRIDNDLAVEGAEAEANKAMEIIILKL